MWGKAQSVARPIAKAGTVSPSFTLAGNVDRAVDADVALVVPQELPQDLGILGKTILRDDGEAAAAARFGDRQLDIANCEPAADPLGFGETAFDRGHVDDDVRPEAPRCLTAPSGCSASSRASEAVVNRWMGDTL